MKTIKYLLLGALLMTFGACNRSNVCGSWVEPVVGQEDKVQGFELKADGTAVSIGMATLLYQRWQRCGDELILSGKSLGNGQTIDFVDTLTIRLLTPDSLVLSRGDYNAHYRRRAE